MENKLLIELAKAILTSLVGQGRWMEPGARHAFEAPDDTIPGLSVGDVVYSYSEDDECLVEDTVLVVADGVGYVYELNRYFGPSLYPVTTEAFGASKEQAIEVWRSTIEADLEYSLVKANNVEQLKSLLGQ